MCICVNSPNKHNFTKRSTATPFQHPLSNKLTNTHSFLFGNVSRGQDFYEFFFFSIVKGTHISNHPLIKLLSNTVTLCLGYHICTMSLTYRNTFEWNLYHYAFKIHPWYSTKGVYRTTTFVRATPCHKKSLKRKLKHVKKWVFFWVVSVECIKKCRKTRVNKKYWEREKNMRIDSKINTGRQCLWELFFFFFQRTGRWSFFYCFY